MDKSCILYPDNTSNCNDESALNPTDLSQVQPNPLLNPTKVNQFGAVFSQHPSTDKHPIP